MRVELKEGSAAWRSYHFRPPDPTWAGSTGLDEARSALAAFDPRLALWWSPTRRAAHDEVRPGRWRVVEWLPNQGNWTTALYWEGENGEYRAPTPVQPLLDRLRAISRRMDEVDRECEEANEKASRKRKEEVQSNLRGYEDDHFQRAHGIRQTFGPGYIRRRQVKPTDLVDTNHERYVRELRGVGP